MTTIRIRRAIVGVVLVLWPVLAWAQDREVVASTLAVGSTPASPTDSSVSLRDLATSGGSEVLLIDTSTYGVRRRALGKSDLPGVVGYTDATQTWSLLQTYTSGLTSNGLLTIGGANDLLLGTGGMRVASGSINLRNIADSANIATFGDSAITLVQPTSLSSTLGVTGLATLTGGAALPNGSAGTPALRFSGDTNTGLYWVSADVLGLSAGGTVRASIGSTAITLAVPTSLSSTLGVTGLSTLTGGFASAANSSVTGNLTVSGTAQVPGWASQTSGWGITSAGAADFRSVFANQARYQSFIADLSEAHNGGQVWVKSTAVVTSFTCPALAGTATLTVQDFPELPNTRVFSSGDQVALFTLTRSDGDSDGATDLTYGYCIGAVTSYSDGTGVQSWTFTRGSGANGGDLATSTVIPAGSLALDYGVTGDGYLEAQVNDGAEGINGPWFQAATWTTSPAPSNRTVRARLGNLRGITSTDEYGLLAGTYAATDGRFFRASDQSFDLHGIDLTIWDGSTQAFALRRNSGAPYFGIGSPAPTSYGSGTGIWMGDDGGTYKFRVGNPSGDRLTWDGSALSIVGNGSGLTNIAGGNIQTGSITATQIASGSITTDRLVAGTISGWTINGSTFNVASTMTLNGTDGLQFNVASSGTDYPRAIRWGTSTTLSGTSAGFLLSQSGTGADVTLRANTGDVILDTDNQSHTFGESQIVLFAGGLSGSVLRPAKDNDMTLGGPTSRLKTAHFALPNDTSPGYVVVGNSSVDSTRLAYIVGYTGTMTIRNAAGTGTCTVTYKTGLVTSHTC